MKVLPPLLLCAGVALLAGRSPAPARAQAPVELTIATVNNPDMVVMQKLTPEFEKAYPQIKLRWVVLPENELRQKVTLEVSQGAGSFDVATVGTYEVPIWAKNGWLISVDDLFSQNADVKSKYDLDDVLAPVRKGLSYQDHLYALPFYAESCMVYYRKDLFQKAGLTMPEQPTWQQVEQFAAKLHNPKGGMYGIALRGLPGWGENLAVFDTVMNTFGGRWFDTDWKAQLNTPPWHQAMAFYADLLRKYGPPGATGNGFTENLTLFSQGRAAMWMDATVAAGYVTDPKKSRVAANVGFANAPVGPGTPNGHQWLWSWSLAIPKSSQHQKAAFQFVTWATSKDYIQLVARSTGNWAGVPPGTRQSTYDNPEYQKAAGAFANIVLDSIKRADPTHPAKDPVPYTGVQFVGIPEFQGLGTDVGQQLAAVIAGKASVDDALNRGQQAAERVGKLYQKTR